MNMRIWRNGRRAGFRFQSERVQVQLLLSAPRQTEIEPELYIRKRVLSLKGKEKAQG